MRKTLGRVATRVIAAFTFGSPDHDAKAERTLYGAAGDSIAASYPLLIVGWHGRPTDVASGLEVSWSARPYRHS